MKDVNIKHFTFNDPEYWKTIEEGIMNNLPGGNTDENTIVTIK